MFYPKCPVCGGATESVEPDQVDRQNMRTKFWLNSQAMSGHPHPLLKAATLAVSVGRQIYKRFPGGGDKRCTSCGHRFN